MTRLTPQITNKNPASAGAQTTNQKIDDEINCLNAELFNSIHPKAAIGMVDS